MGKQYGFYIDVDRCVQCHACEVACKVHNSIELGIKWRQVVGIWAGQLPNLTNRSISFACMHCGEPSCVTVCPEGAITKRPKDGIVVVERSKCVGCGSCSESCPFGAPQIGKDGTMQKCTLCVNRLAQGMQPICVKTCPGEALHFGTMEELSKLGSAKKAKMLAGSTQPSMLISSSKWSTLKSVLNWKQ